MGGGDWIVDLGVDGCQARRLADASSKSTAAADDDQHRAQGNASTERSHASNDTSVGRECISGWAALSTRMAIGGGRGLVYATPASSGCAPSYARVGLYRHAGCASCVDRELGLGGSSAVWWCPR